MSGAPREGIEERRGLKAGRSAGRPAEFAEQTRGAPASLAYMHPPALNLQNRPPPGGRFRRLRALCRPHSQGEAEKRRWERAHWRTLRWGSANPVPPC